MKTTRHIIVGTRKSPLAISQAEEVVKDLKKFFPKYKFIIRGITTAGDRIRTDAFEKIKGVFVKEIEELLINNKIDFAVHSLKDLPCKLAQPLEISAVTRRISSADVLISRGGKKINFLAFGSSVGTSSPRRKIQLLAFRPDLRIKDIRGNLDTRLRKLKAGQYDAIVVAAAGIFRLGLKKEISEFIPPKIMLPAPGQGALAIETRKDNPGIKNMVKKINHEKSRIEVSAERAFLEAMGGGCRLPIAALAELKKGSLKIQGVFAAKDNVSLIRASLAGDPEFPEKTGRELAEKIKSMLKRKKNRKNEE